MSVPSSTNWNQALGAIADVTIDQIHDITANWLEHCTRRMHDLLTTDSFGDEVISDGQSTARNALLAGAVIGIAAALFIRARS
jgi:hypothetical protein